jgi:enoyl-CoA hydratase/carnithine racemase
VATHPWSEETTLFETLSVEFRGAIGELRLDRPEKLNALSIQTLEEIAAAARYFDEQRDVKVVVVSGAGRAFSAGADLASFSHALGDGSSKTTHEVAEIGRRMADSLEAMRALSIARIHGWCIGGGFVLASACDLRVASEDARFSIPEVDLGIPLTWGGIPRMVREIGPALTKELVLTCRPFDAEEARSMGFLNRVVPAEALDSEVHALATSLSRKASHALFSTKRHVNAITDQMVGTSRSWADADSMVAAFQDEECKQIRRDYLTAHTGKAAREGTDEG